MPSTYDPVAFYRFVVLLLSILATAALLGGLRALARREFRAWTPAGSTRELHGAAARWVGLALCVVGAGFAGLAWLAWRHG